MASTSSSPPVTLSSTLSLPKSCSSHTTNKIENLVEYSYIPESAQISESSYPLLSPYHLYKRPSSFTRSIRTLISTRRPHPKEYIQSSCLDQCSLQATPAEQYVTLEIPSELISNWKREGYTHLHLGGIRLILTLHGRKGLPVTARLAMLDTRFKQYQDAVIGTVLTTLHAGSVLLTFYPNFNLSLQDPNLPTTLKVQVQIQGAEQISSAKIATLHYQLVYRLQNHALDLPTPEHHSDTLMVLAEFDQIPTIIQIPRQIPRHELIKLMPLEWISNYEQFHNNTAPIQTSESMFERRQDGTVRMTFKPPPSAPQEPPRLSFTYSSMITAVQTAQEDLPITGFNSEGYPDDWEEEDDYVPRRKRKPKRKKPPVSCHHYDPKPPQDPPSPPAPLPYYQKELQWIAKHCRSETPSPIPLPTPPLTCMMFSSTSSDYSSSFPPLERHTDSHRNVVSKPFIPSPTLFTTSPPIPSIGPTYHPFASMLSPIRQYDPSKLFCMTHTLFRDNPLTPPPKPKPKLRPQPRPVTFHIPGQHSPGHTPASPPVPSPPTESQPPSQSKDKQLMHQFSAHTVDHSSTTADQTSDSNLVVSDSHTGTDTESSVSTSDSEKSYVDITIILMAQPDQPRPGQTSHTEPYVDIPSEVKEEMSESSATNQTPPAQAHTSSPNQKSSNGPWFTFDDLPSHKWRDRVNEMSAWIDLQMLRPGATTQSVLREFATRFTGALRDWTVRRLQREQRNSKTVSEMDNLQDVGNLDPHRLLQPFNVQEGQNEHVNQRQPDNNNIIYMADDRDRAIRDYAVLTPQVVHPGIVIPEVEAANFELKPMMFQMLQIVGQFNGLTFEDPHLHLKLFLEVSDAFKIAGATQDALRLNLFPYSLRDRARAWLNSLPSDSITTWNKLADKFLTNYFPPTKNAKLQNEIAFFINLKMKVCMRLGRDLKSCSEGVLIMAFLVAYSWKPSTMD
ncbi:hypothetical protein KPL71_026373 [Citrus sinensis]|uniref:Uncharacterized protein n=1 Tax=Citrus sinensis TaxID=2711 RepID=A0ACB8HZ57_CITSI|nr:hypothetical protein KPL71_026373 [Citrus sinensis]